MSTPETPNRRALTRPATRSTTKEQKETNPVTEHTSGPGGLVSPDQLAALETARELARMGVPVFLGRPAFDEAGARDWKAGAGGYLLPPGWQHTKPDPAVLDDWRPGMAVCVVTGHAFDVLDVDEQASGSESYEQLDLLGEAPTSFGQVATPSGGWHDYIAPTGRAKVVGLMPGVDVLAGTPDGDGLGFAFAPPTEKRSKLTGEIRPYTWTTPPTTPVDDGSNAALVARMDARKTAKPKPVHDDDADPFAPLTDREQEKLQAIMAKELRAVEASEAGRNNAVSHALCVLFPFVHAGHLDRDEVEDRVWEAVPGGSHPYERHEFQASSDWAWDNSEPQRPTVVDVLAAFADEDPTAEGGEVPAVAPVLPAIPQTFDPKGYGTGDDLAKVIAQAISPVYRFATDSGQWYRRDDVAHVWMPLVGKPVEPVRGALAELIEAMPKGERPETGKDAPPPTEANFQWLRRDALDGAKRGTTAALVVDAARSPKLSIRSGDLDADPSVLWAGGYPIDLRRSGDRIVLAEGLRLTTPHTKSAAVVPRDGVPTPRADNLLRVCLDDEDRESFLNLAALSITGLSPKVIVVAYGDTDTGKTFTTGLVCRLLGNYAGEVSARVLTNAGSEFDQHDLKGLRLGYRDEGMRDTRSGTEALKELAGAKTRIRGAKKGHDSVEFVPTHTLWLSDNKLPQVADPAVRSRVRPLAYRGDRDEVQAAVRAILGDDDGETWLRTEGPGFLANLVHRAARAWADLPGLIAVSASAAADLERFAIEQDPFKTWLIERTDQGTTGDETLGGELYDDFKAWAADGNHYRRPGDTIPTSTAFGRLLTNDGFPSRHSSNGSRRRLKLWPSEQLRKFADAS